MPLFIRPYGPSRPARARASRQVYPGNPQLVASRRIPGQSSVAGVRLPPLAGASPPLLELGGETSYVKSYAELTTSVINPNHIVSEHYRERFLWNAEIPPAFSPMPMPHIDRMTVRELIDLVAFLDARYVLVDDYVSSP